MGNPFEYDPDRALWVMGRRSFCFLTGSAALGAVLAGPKPSDEQVRAVLSGFAGTEADALQWMLHVNGDLGGFRPGMEVVRLSR